MKKFIIISLFLCLLSCTSRKVEVNKSDSKEIATTNYTLKTIEKSILATDTKKDVQEDNYTYTPINKSAEFVVNGKVYKNVEIRRKIIKDNSIITELKIVDKKQDLSIKKAINNTSKINKKQVEKKGVSLSAKIALLIMFVILVAAYLKRRYL